MTSPAITSFDEQWDRTEVHTVSPNEQVFVTVRGDREVTVSFAPGYYERATRQQLVEQLQRTARQAFLDRTRAFFDELGRDRGTTIRPSRSIVTAQDAEYWRRLDALEATGSSSDGSVSGVLLGSEQLTVQIAPGTQDRLDAYAFAAAASEAATRMLADHLAKAMQVKLDVYLPEQLR